MGQHHVHAEAGHQADDALGHAEGLAVAGRVGPGHGDLLAAQLVHAAEVVNEMEGVGHTLGGVVDVALEVDQGGPLLQHAVPVALLHRVGHLFHIGVALADVHIVPDADDVGHEGDHIGGLTDGLAVGNLALALVQVLDLQAQQVAGRGKGKAGAGGVVPEQGDAQAGVKETGGDIPLPQVPQGVCHREHTRQLLAGLVPGEEEVLSVHVFQVQGLEFPDDFIKLRAHAHVLLGSKFHWNKHSISPAGINRYFVNNFT